MFAVDGQKPVFDERDAALVEERRLKRDGIKGPRVGDFVKMLDGTMRRFTHDWGDSLQTTTKNSNGYGFFLCDGGGVSYSGSLDHAIPLARLRQLGGRRDGWFWMFHHNWWQASNGVDFKLPCRLYEQLADGA